MCGITGLWQGEDRRLSRDRIVRLVNAMNDSIMHRGPDSDGVWAEAAGRCALGQRRLSVIDTSDAGRQPFASNNGRWWITYNGELYNFRDLHRDLYAAGVRFRGRTDTEVVLEAIALWGVEALNRFDGMFALAAYDIETRTLLLARDPFGEKPLYYTALPGGGLAFASELHALELLPGVDLTVDVEAVGELLSFQYIGAPRSIYSSIKKLPPGHWLRVDADGRQRIEPYFSFEPGSNGYTSRSKADLIDELEDILVRSIRGRLIADVPLGAFLSRGVDSSTVCALVRSKLGQPLKTFSTGFAGVPESEHMIAREFANLLGTNHHEQIVDPQAVEFLYKIGDLLDEPNADSSCLPVYMLSEFARKHVTVAISGDGGDELFGGYGRYLSTLNAAAAEPSSFRPGDYYYNGQILISSEPHIVELFGFLLPEVANHLASLRRDLNDAHPQDLLARLRRTDARNYLPGAVLAKVDRMSMQHALEVRTPFLNVELARFAERLPPEMLTDGRRGKLLLRELAYRYLPRHLIDLPKQGFGPTTPDWARASLLGIANDLLRSDESRVVPLFGREGIERFIARQSRPNGFVAYQVWALAMLESWLRHHPASVPDLAPMRAKSLAEAKVEMDIASQVETTVAARVAEGIWLVSTGAPDRLADPRLLPSWEAVPLALRIRVAQLVGHAQGSGMVRPDTVHLPEPGQPLSPTDTARLRALEGATLVFLCGAINEELNYAELLKYSRLRVGRLIYMIRPDDTYTEEITLQPKALRRRILHCARLFLRSRATVSNRSLFRFLLGAKPFAAEADTVNAAPELKRLPDSGMAELSDRFIAFEGLRQLPPLQASPADIAHLGGGRYSIMNQALRFSPTSPGRQFRLPYWVVERTPKTEPLLQFVRNRRAIDGGIASPSAKRITPRIWLVMRHAIAGILQRWRQRSRRSIPSHLVDAMDTLLNEDIDRNLRVRPGDRIVVLTSALHTGGAERQWIYLARGLKNAGYNVTFIIYSKLIGDQGHYPRLLREAGIRLKIVPPAVPALSELSATHPVFQYLVASKVIPDLGTVCALTDAFRRLQPKAVIAQLDGPNQIAGAAALLAGVPRMVMSFRSYNPSNYPWFYQDWFRAAYALLTQSKRVLLCGNTAVGNLDYARWIGIEPERVVCIPNALDFDHFPEPSADEIDAVRRELSIVEDTPVVLGVFRFSQEKRPEVFLEVCVRLLTTYPQLRVLVAGVGSLLDEMRQLVSERGLANSIQFLGRRDDVGTLMAIANLLLLTSEREGMPNVVIEAQRMHLPVVATDAGGTREAFLPGESGLLCPVGDIDALETACLQILADPILADRMGEAGYRHAETEFALDLMAQRYIDLINGDADSSSLSRLREAQQASAKANRETAATFELLS
jgi:asparagine synthase (glutamine-hydrolysing)